MGVIDEALSLGHKAKDILDTLIQENPEFAKRASQAIASGYSVEEILRSVASSFQDPRSEKVAKSMGFHPKYARNLAFSAKLDPATVIPDSMVPKDQGRGVRQGLGSLAGAGLGAAAGFALGGPAGALRGGAAGYTGGTDLLKSYEKHRAEGGQMSLGDFISAGAKAAGAGLAAGQAASLLKPGESKQQAPSAPSEPPSPPAEDKRPYMERAREMMEEEGIDFFSLSGPRKKRVGILMNRLRDLQEEGKPWDHRSVQAVRRKIMDFAKGEGLSTVELEEENVERQQAAPQAAPEMKEKPERSREVMQESISKVGDLVKEHTAPLERDVKPIQALKSSNVRYASYDPEKQKLQVLFAPSGKYTKGQIYEYFDVPAEDVESFRAGADAAVTTGENAFRAWYRGKDPSLGAAFDEFIKQRDEKGDYKYPYRVISEDYVDDKELLKVRGADQVFKASLYFDAFDDIATAAKAKQKAPGMKAISDALKDLDDDLLASMITEVERQIKAELKAKPTKRYKGGRQAEITRRVEEQARGRSTG